jgi:hypothetical protein
MPVRERARLGALQALEGGLRHATDGGRRHETAAARSMTRVAALVRRQRFVDIPAERLQTAAGPGVRAPSNPRPEVLLLALSHAAPDVRVRPVPSDEVAQRMRHSLEEEDQRLQSCYHKFRYAFPGRRNELFERAAELRAAALDSALAGLRAFEVRHPYPVPLEPLYRELRGTWD